MQTSHIIKKFKTLSRKFFFFVGISIFLVSVISELFLFDGKIGSPLIVLFSVSLSWIIYPFVPEKYTFEKNFSFVFLNLFSLIYVLPIILIKIHTNTLGTQSPEIFRDDIVYYFLGLPLSNLLNSLGYSTWASGDVIFFEDLEVNHVNSVSISTGCSGIYSTFIFLCALFSYLAVSHNITRYNLLTLSILGLLVSYSANLVRMAIIVIIGHYFGLDALMFAHANIGWLIFSTWIFLFWLFLEKFLQYQKSAPT